MRKVSRSPIQSLNQYFEARYYAMSHNADRSVVGLGDFKKGVWKEVPRSFYEALVKELAEGEISGKVIGWKVKIEKVLLEGKK